MNSSTALPTSVVTVPVFGFGIRPRGPRVRPSLPTWPMRSGVAIATSKSRKPPSTRATRSSAPDDVGAGLLGGPGRVTRGEDDDAHGLAAALGQRHRAAQHLVRLAGVDAEPERGLDGLVEVLARQAPHELERLGRVVELLAVEAPGASVYFLP